MDDTEKSDEDEDEQFDENEENEDEDIELEDEEDEDIELEDEEDEEAGFEENEENVGLEEDENLENEDVNISGATYTPQGTKVWIPTVGENIKPQIGSVYCNLDVAISMYLHYATAGGFEIILGTQKKNNNDSINLKYATCSRYGKRTHKANSNEKPKRRTNSKKTGCKACIKFKAIQCTPYFRVYGFEETHNHPLIPPHQMHLTRRRRQIQFSDQEFIQKCSSRKIGATKAYNLLCGIKGGYDTVSGTKVDFKNNQRDVNKYIGASDCDMVISKMKNRQEHRPNFTFEYKVENNELVGAFWADETSKCNYEAFGDVVSFDATFRTNKYSMVFVPFTGIDNHNKCVTFGAAVLKNELAVTYEWLLRCFLQAFKKEPLLVVTDQCPSMKKAIRAVFKTAKHRLCMWHICNKLTSRVSKTILSTTNFRKDFNNIVWNRCLTQESFEEKWNELITEHNLTNNKWLSLMFRIRQRWIPAYFRNLSMSGLMRTSSRSESENSFFSNFAHYGAPLFRFFDSFDAAMDKQRHEQNVLDHKNKTTTPEIKHRSALEEHASKVYTDAIFLLVQTEIECSFWECSITNEMFEDGKFIHMVADRAFGSGQVNDEQDTECVSNVNVLRERNYKVSVNKQHDTIVCDCLHFIQRGFLCRHAFCVMRRHDYKKIPSKYISRRWTKDIIPSIMLQKRYWPDEQNEKRLKLVLDARSVLDNCISKLSNNDLALEKFVKTLRSLEAETLNEVQSYSIQTKESVIESLIGAKKQGDVQIQNPTGVRNKGCGTGKRLKSAVEKSFSESSKKKRQCKKCSRYEGHDSRTCPLNKKN